MAAPNPLPQPPLGNGGSRPVPDPTLLTTAYVREAVANLREIIETRLDGMDKAIKLLQDTTDRLPCMMNEKVEHLEALHKEKFESIQTQFLERDVRSDKTAEQTKTAVDAALQAAEKAVNKQNESSTASIDKSEKGVIKLLDGLDGKISDVKDRVTRIEGLGIGRINAETKQEAKSTSNQNWIGLMIAAIVGAAGIIIAIVLRN